MRSRLVRVVSAVCLLVLTALETDGCRSQPPSGSSYALRAFWTGGGIPGGSFDRPFGIATGPDGSVYVTDARERVARLSADGKYVAEWGHAGDGPGEFSNPAGVAVAPDGNVYVSDYDQDRIQKFTAEGRFLLALGSHGRGPGQFRAPAGLAIDKQGHVYVADFYNSRIEEFTSDGKMLRVVGHPGRRGAAALHYPTGVAALADGSLIVADAYNYELQRFDQGGGAMQRIGYRLLWLWPRPAEGSGGFDAPTGVAVGPRGVIHVADSANHRVAMFSEDGRYLGQWKLPEANPKIYSPEQVAVSNDGSVVYATDFAGNRVIVLSVKKRTN